MDIWRLICLVFISFLVGGPAVLSQNPVYKRYTIDDGLPSNEVYDAIQDRHGNVWFATDHGVSRFDGYAFTNYATPQGLTDNTVFGFTMDPTGRLWMRCMNGTLTYYDDLSGMQAYPFNAVLQEKLAKSWIEVFEIDRSGQMYLTSSAGRSYQLNLLRGQIRPIAFPPGTDIGILHGPGMPRPLLVQCDTLLGEGQPAGKLVPLGDSAFFWREIGIEGQKTFFSRPCAAQLGPDNWVATSQNHLWRIVGGKLSAQTVPDRISNIQQDRLGKWWVASDDIAQVSDSMTTVDRWFESEKIISMLQDREGSYWLTTSMGVLFVRNPDYRSYPQIGPHGLGEVTRLRIADSTLYLNGDASVVYIVSLASLERGHPDVRTVSIPSPHPHDILPMPDRQALLVKGRIYDLPTHGDSQKGPRIQIHGTFGSPWSYDRVGDSIWIGGNWGIGKVNLRDGQLLTPLPGTTPEFLCSAIAEDGSGRVWIGMADGLFNWVHGELVRFAPTLRATHARVTSITHLPDGIAVATRGEGILLIEGDRVRQIRASNGLSTDLCDRVYLGPSGLWICSNRGLDLIRSQTAKPILHFDAGNGISSDQVNDVVELDGRAIVATPDGLVIFRVPQQKAPQPDLPIRVLALQTNRRTYQTEAWLESDEDFLEFTFAAPLLSMPGKSEYQYFLAGRDHMLRTTTERKVAYHDLPAGDYEFQVRARAPGGQWSPQAATMHVHRAEKLYRRTWFLIGLSSLIGAVGCVIGWAIWRARKRRRLSNLYRLQAEIKALRSQMRPHFIFNALNSIQQLILLQDNATAQMHLGEFARLMRNILEATNHELIPISKEIEILEAYLALEKLRFGDHFAYHISVDDGIDPAQYRIPPMLLQPLVENAIWHGLQLRKKEPTLWLRFAISPSGGVCIEVEDNGIGRQAAAQIVRTHVGPSVAVANIEERIRLINAAHRQTIHLKIIDLLDSHGQARGTCVQIFIPIFRHELLQN